MALFFIHVENHDFTQHDEHGREFSNADVAIAEAAHTAGEILRDEASRFDESITFKVKVEDADHASVCEIDVKLNR